MRTTLAIDDALLAKAMGLTGLKERSALVPAGQVPVSCDPQGHHARGGVASGPRRPRRDTGAAEEVRLRRAIRAQLGANSVEEAVGRRVAAHNRRLARARAQEAANG